MLHPNEVLNLARPGATEVAHSITGSATAANATGSSTSPGAAIAAMIVVLVLVIAAVVTLIVWLRRRARAKARIAAMSPVERERYDAEAEYLARLSAAQKALTAETKARAGRLKASEKALAAAHTIGNHTIASYRGKDGSARITETDITVPQGTFPLTPGVHAAVDTAGNLATSSRSTLTRIATGGLLFGPVGAIVGGVAKKTKTHDLRELYLLITGDAFATMITCNPDDGAKVRQFAVAVAQAALRSDQVRTHRAETIAQTQQALAAEQQNTAPVDAARAALEAATADTARMDAATRALEAARAVGAQASGPRDLPHASGPQTSETN